MTFDEGRDIRLFWDRKAQRNYLRCCHYSGEAVYGGVELCGAKAVRFSASSICGGRDIVIEAGGERLTARLAPSDGYADFAEYEVSLPENIIGDSLRFVLQQDCAIRDIFIIHNS